MAPMDGHVCPEHNLTVFKLEAMDKKIDEQGKKLDAIKQQINDLTFLINELQQIRNQTTSHEAALFGTDRQSGIVADMRDLKEDRATRNKILIAIVTFITGNIAWLWSVFLNSGSK